MHAGKRFEPTSIPGSTKYGGQGGGDKSMFEGRNLPEHVKEKVASWVNHGKTNKTWSAYAIQDS